MPPTSDGNKRVKNDIIAVTPPDIDSSDRAHLLYGLCLRCEWRIRYYETGRGPRCECQSVGSDPEKPRASCGCYMYMPVLPAVLAVRPGDKRSHTAPALFRARMGRDATGCPDMVQVSRESGRKLYQHFVYWLPKSLLPVLERYWKRLARKGKGK